MTSSSFLAKKVCIKKKILGIELHHVIYETWDMRDYPYF
jgi:wyosine [tRNA(Phe)-imidazoG37] synthetase (radical SAM superfamily)